MEPRQSQQKRYFGTLDLIMLVVLCGTVSSVVGASVAGLLHDDRPVRARQSAQSLASQIRQQHEVALQGAASNGRSPASVREAQVPPLTDGQLGKDPWGRPYFYTVLGTVGDSNATIVVWSEGPNGKLDSKIDDLSESNVMKFRFKGDDVGIVSNPRFASRDIRRSR
jgi:hypothetical protein